MSDAVSAIRRIASGTPAEGDLDWIAERMRDYLAAPERGLESALWLDNAPGEPPWWLAERRRERDGLILRLWRERFPGLSAWDAAERIATAQQRYAAAAWLHHRTMDDPPSDPTASLLWKAMRLKVGFPKTRRHIYSILNNADRDALY